MKFSSSLLFNYREKECAFRSIFPKDVTNAYVEGLRQENKYLSHIPEKLDLSSQQEYISQISRSINNAICGLFVGDELIGTAGLQNLAAGNYATIGIFLFNPLVRGMGFGKILVWSASQLAIHQMSVAGTMGGMKPDNIVSIRSFLACGGIESVDSDTGTHHVHISATNLLTLPGLTKIRFSTLYQ